MLNRSPPTLYPDQISWEETGHESDPKARLYAHIRIASVDMHLEAWQVEEVDDLQTATAASYRSDDFGALAGMMDCAFETLEIQGREYVLVATPFGR